MRFHELVPPVSPELYLTWEMLVAASVLAPPEVTNATRWLGSLR